jgi:uncharacterized protein YegJ (DUF2314 family)
MFEAIVGVIVVGSVLLAFLAYQRSQSPIPPPNPIAADDSEMAVARSQAQSTLDEFRSLFAAYPNTSQVKLPVTSSTGMVEWMVGSVLELTSTYVKVDFRGRPATHRGAFQSIQSFPTRDIADWHVTLSNGRYRGGYTQRVHYQRMRAAGALVDGAAEEAAKYD